VCWCYVLRWIWCLWCYSIWVYWYRKDRVFDSHRGRANFSTCPVWMYTQSNTTNIIVTTCWQTYYKPVANTSCWQVVRFLLVRFWCVHVKIHKLLQDCKQVITNMFTSCRQVAFTLLVNAKFVTSFMGLSGLLQGCSNKSDTVMIYKNVTMLTTQVVTILLCHDWIRLVGTTLRQVW
jgi:uncharacterized membrane protein